MLFLHGFPEFWWAWRHQLPLLAAAGYRAAAMDLRGYGGSDKTPRGYDPATLSGDVAGVVRSLGARDAVLVGHGWGGYVAWASAVLHPSVARGLCAVAAPHPRQLLRAVARDRAQLAAARHVLAVQVPLVPERRIMAADGAYVEQLLRRWTTPGNGFPDAEEARRYRNAMRLWPSPHCALEYHRWWFRSRFRTDGRRFARAMRRRVRVPVLQVHGDRDPAVLRSSVAGSARYVAAPYRLALLAGVGHFPHEEAPGEFGEGLLDWLAELGRPRQLG